MDYAGYRRRGLPIGSGVTEAACKTVFTQRFKRSGMRWGDESGQVILDLRAVYLSGIWDEAFAVDLDSRELPIPSSVAWGIANQGSHQPTRRSIRSSCGIIYDAAATTPQWVEESEKHLPHHKKASLVDPAFSFLDGAFVCILAISDGILCAQAVKAKPEAEATSALSAKEKHRFNLPKRAQKVIFSSNGEMLAIGTDGVLFVHEMSSGMEKLKLDYGRKTTFPEAFSSTGNHLLVYLVDKGRMVKCLEVSSGRDVFSISDAGGLMAYFPGEKEFVSYFGGSIQFRSAKDGALVREFTGTFGNLGHCVLSSNGKLLAEDRPDGTIKIRRINPEEDVIVLKGPELSGISVHPASCLHA